MSGTRGRLHLKQMRQAAEDALSFVAGQSEEEFLTDKRTQQAVIMSLMIIDEAAARLREHEPDFVATHTAIPWTAMRNMRNRIAHGYDTVNLGVVWDTIQTALPDLLQYLPFTSD